MLKDEDIDAIAARAAPPGAVLERHRELEQGLVYFYRWPEADFASCGMGTVGLIVNKTTGKVFHLGSAHVEEDIADYEAGFQFRCVDLVVTAVLDAASTLELLEGIGPTVVEPEYADGTVWRIARPLTTEELRDRIEKVPCVFPGVSLRSWGVKLLQEATRHGAFEFLALEYPHRDLAPEWDRRHDSP